MLLNPLRTVKSNSDPNIQCDAGVGECQESVLSPPDTSLVPFIGATAYVQFCSLVIFS